MKVPNPTLQQVFCEVVPASFDFLVSEYGFSLTKEDDGLFRAESPHCRIMMELDKNRFGAWLERITTVSKLGAGQEFVRKAIGITVIAQCLGHRFDDSVKRASDIEELRRAIDIHIELLRRYCVRMLGGDFSEWPMLEACVEERERLWSLESKRQTREYRLSDIRCDVESAWRKKDYAKVVSLYETMRDDLTAAEARKLEYARKHLQHPL